MTLRIHRKFIGSIAAAAIAITSFAAAPAQARDKDNSAAIAALLGLAIVGAVIHEKRKDKKKRQAAHVQPQVAPTPYVAPKPKPHRVNRKLLPQRCLRSAETNRGYGQVFGQKCLSHHYAYVDTLPYTCHRDVYSHKGVRNGYSAHCLTRHGYQLARH